MAFLTSLALSNSKVKRCIHTCIASCTCNQPLADAALCKQKSWLLFALCPHRFHQHSTVLSEVPPTIYCTMKLYCMHVWDYKHCLQQSRNCPENECGTFFWNIGNFIFLSNFFMLGVRRVIDCWAKLCCLNFLWRKGLCEHECLWTPPPPSNYSKFHTFFDIKHVCSAWEPDAASFHSSWVMFIHRLVFQYLAVFFCSYIK